MPELLIDLDLIDDNPNQDRNSYDDIAELGRSIALAGLQQQPKARQVGKRYQLKFGHRRKRAFEWLRDNWVKEELTGRYNGYTVMPLEVEAITDDEMFDGVLIENAHRDDLKVTERARLLRRYKQAHPEATSEKIGLVFNMNAATVRGMDIFLDLPEEGQALLDKGIISQGAARLLCSMMKIASKKEVLETITLIEKEKGITQPEEVIDIQINRLKNTEDMWSDQHGGKPRSGYRGWLLDMKNFPNKLLPAMTVEQVGAYEAQLDHLLNPPACTACPFYTKVRGSHYCGIKLCHQRKQVAWELSMVEQASKSTKIAMYTEADGTYRALNTYSDKAMFDKRHKDLRLIAKSKVRGYPYQNFNGINDDYAIVVATGEELLGKLARSSGSTGGVRGGKKTEKEKAEMRAMKIYRINRLELMWAYTAAAQTIFEGAPVGVLNKLNEWNHIGIDDRIPDEYNHPSTGDAAQKLSFQRRALVWRLIMNKTSHYTRSGMVEALEKFANVTGVKAPKSLIKRAEEWDAEIKAAASVSTATVKGKKK